MNATEIAVNEARELERLKTADVILSMLKKKGKAETARYLEKMRKARSEESGGGFRNSEADSRDEGAQAAELVSKISAQIERYRILYMLKEEGKSATIDYLQGLLQD